MPLVEKPVIRVIGARQNNLKDITLDIPLNQLTVITGISGSGKSSFAFDTLFAEGQRRYVESFSAYARQFLDRLDRPQVELIEGLPPAIAIRQVNTIKTARSTVATLTELAEYIKLLFANHDSAGERSFLLCPQRPRDPRRRTDRMASYQERW